MIVGYGEKMNIIIETANDEDKLKIGNHIHEQLVGNKDYIDSNIILNIEEPNKVRLYVYDECEYIPPITIF